MASARAQREQAPNPISHAAPDVELAEAQVAYGREELDEETVEEVEALEPTPAAVDGGDGDGVGAGVLEEEPEPEVPAALPEVRPALSSRLIAFLQGSWRELQRVQWPDRRQVIQATAVVLGFVIVAAVFLGVADTLSTKLMNFILK